MNGKYLMNKKEKHLLIICDKHYSQARTLRKEWQISLSFSYVITKIPIRRKKNSKYISDEYHLKYSFTSHYLLQNPQNLGQLTRAQSLYSLSVQVANWYWLQLLILSTHGGGAVGWVVATNINSRFKTLAVLKLYN